MPLVSWLSLALTRKRKTLELPDGATQIRIEFGGWYSDRDIYVWWKDQYGIDKCKKIVSTRWQDNMKHISFKVEESITSTQGEK